MEKTAVSDELINAYLRTDYKIYTRDGEFVLNVRKKNFSFEHFLLKQNFYNCAVITAWNPHSIRKSPEENLSQNKKLEALLTERKFFFFVSQAMDESGLWNEPGYCVTNIDRIEAEKIGKIFGQNAIVFYEVNSVPALIFIP